MHGTHAAGRGRPPTRSVRRRVCESHQAGPPGPLRTQQQAVVLEVDVVHDEKPRVGDQQEDEHAALRLALPPRGKPCAGDKHRVADDHAAALRARPPALLERSVS